jgi:hypothetical protein
MPYLLPRSSSVRRQYLYFCTSKPSKLSRKLALASEKDRKIREEEKVGLSPRLARSSSGVSICTLN